VGTALVAIFSRAPAHGPVGGWLAKAEEVVLAPTSIRAPKRFVSVAGDGHNDLGARAVSAAKKFIAGMLADYSPWLHVTSLAWRPHRCNS